MCERIFDCLDNGFIEFGLLAFHLDAYLFITTQRHITYGSRKLAPDVSDGLHAGLHDLFL